MDFSGRYKNLQRDFAHICRTVGAGELSLPHKRRATDRKKDFGSDYSAELAELVGEYFRHDIEVLGYRFEITGR